MIKVLHTLDSYLPITQNWIAPQIASVPGTETAVLCKWLSKSGFSPPVMRRLYSENPDWNCRSWTARVLRSALRRARVFKATALFRAAWWHPTVLHAHFGPRGWETLWIKRRLQLPLVTEFYGVDVWALPAKYPIWRARYHDLFREGDIFLVEGPAMRQRLIDIGCPAAKIRVRHLGVDVEQIEFVAPDFSRGLRIAMVGRFVEKKGFVDGLTACRDAARAGARLEVTIIGDAFPDDLAGKRIKEALTALAQMPELAGRVRFAGFLSPSEMRSLLREHNLILCPSKHAPDGDAEGGMPFVLAEAMAMGIIGIGSNHCDMSELIIDGETGFLFEEEDIGALANILTAMAGRQDRLQDMAVAGRRHIEGNFDLSRQLEALRDVYLECAASTVETGTEKRAA